MLIKIFSYNIHGLPIILDSWSVHLAKWFQGCKYDFICLQEVFTSGFEEILSKSLKENGYSVFCPKNQSKLFNSGLLTGIKDANWTIIGERFIHYNLGTGVDLLAHKGFHAITVENKHSKERLIIINTHMQSDNPTNYFLGCIDTRPIRMSQAQQIHDYLIMCNHKHIIIGDLNSETESHEEMLYLTGAKFGINTSNNLGLTLY
jgi:exonuclease III